MTSAPIIEVRDAIYGDADAMCDAQVAGWRAAYRGLFPDSYLDSDDFDASRRAWWLGGSWLDTAVTHTFAGLVDSQVLGFSVVGPERFDDAPAVPGQGEVYSFYLQPQVWGSGLARDLMDASERWLRERGLTELSLWVLRDNPRARSFYEKSGWAWSGAESLWAGPTMPGILRPDPVAEVRYARTL